MDQLKIQFWHAGTFYLSIAVIIVTFFVRRIVEQAVPSFKKLADESEPKALYKTKLAEWWNSVILYALPVGFGILGALIWRSYFCPVGMTGKNAVMFGAIVGWFSSFFYKVVRKTLKKKTGIDPVPGPVDPTEKDPDVDARGDDDEKNEEERKTNPVISPSTEKSSDSSS